MQERSPLKSIIISDVPLGNVNDVNFHELLVKGGGQFLVKLRRDVVSSLKEELSYSINSDDDFIDILVISSKYESLPLEPFKKFKKDMMGFNWADVKPYSIGFCFERVDEIPVSFLHVKSVSEFNSVDYLTRRKMILTSLDGKNVDFRQKGIIQVHPATLMKRGVRNHVVDAIGRWERKFPEEADERIGKKNIPDNSNGNAYRINDSLSHDSIEETLNGVKTNYGRSGLKTLISLATKSLETK